MTQTASFAGRMPDQRYRALADSMPQIVWSADADGQPFYYNRRWYEYTGLSEADALVSGFSGALHPDDIQHTATSWRRTWQDGKHLDIECRLRRHDGVYHWFVVRAEPVRDPQGRILEWAGTCTDIDNQKRAVETQAFLSEASKLLASTLDYEVTLTRVAQLAVPHIADWCAVDILTTEGELRRLAVAHVDPAKVELAWELQRRFPFDPNAVGGVAEVLRSGRSEMIPVIPEELVRNAISDPELLTVVLALGLKSSMVVPLVARGRTLGAITMVGAESGRFFTEDDLALAEELAQRAAVAVDNAELFRELRRFRETLDATIDCVYMYRPDDLRFFYVNRGTTEHLGYSREELLGMTTVDIKPAFTEQEFRAILQPLLDGEQTAHTFQTVHRHKQGHDMPVEIVLQYVAPPDEEGRFVAVVRDMSERKLAEEALRASEQRFRELAEALEARNRELDQFAYITSHDLKAPLRGIANLAQWVEEDLGAAVTDEAHQHLELLRGRVNRMEGLIDGILQYSRVGRVSNAVQQVNVAGLVADVVDLLAPPPSTTVTIEQGLPMISVEQLPLQQVFQNLIGNALKHGGAGVQIVVRCRERGKFYEFAVADDGPGIAPQYHERIFGMFQTLVSRDKVEGSGLGLALIKKIIEHHGGKVWLESTPGAGTTFFFTWPKERRLAIR